jgi:hypothetical protein
MEIATGRLHKGGARHLKRRLKKNAVGILVLFLLALCAGCRDAVYTEIRKAPPAQERFIAQGLNPGLGIKNAYYIGVKTEYPGCFYVAAEIYGKNNRGDSVGLWIIEGLEAPRNALAVNQAAVAFSLFKPSAREKPRAGFNMKEARALRNFVERRYYR